MTLDSLPAVGPQPLLGLNLQQPIDEVFELVADEVVLPLPVFGGFLDHLLKALVILDVLVPEGEVVVGYLVGQHPQRPQIHEPLALCSHHHLSHAGPIFIR